MSNNSTTDRSALKKILLWCGFLLLLLFFIGYGIGVYLGELELEFSQAIAFFLSGLPTLVLLALVLGALPCLVIVIALNKKKDKRD